MMLEDTTAFVTGASQGIGREIAVVFAEYGANVALAARSDGIEDARDEIGDPDRALPVRTDVTDEESVKSSIEETVDEFGGLDCLVNNAGISLVSEGLGGPLHEIEVDDWRRVQEVNVMGTVICSKYAIPHLIESRGGSIINIASIAGKGPYTNGSAYAASKAAMINLGVTLAHELGEHDVRVNSVSPAGVEARTGRRHEIVTEMHAERNDVSYEEQLERALDRAALDSFVQARDVAELTAFLASPKGAMITAQDINISGGKAWY